MAIIWPHGAVKPVINGLLLVGVKPTPISPSSHLCHITHQNWSAPIPNGMQRPYLHAPVRGACNAARSHSTHASYSLDRKTRWEIPRPSAHHGPRCWYAVLFTASAISPFLRHVHRSSLDPWLPTLRVARGSAATKVRTTPSASLAGKKPQLADCKPAASLPCQRQPLPSRPASHDAENGVRDSLQLLTACRIAASGSAAFHQTVKERHMPCTDEILTRCRQNCRLVSSTNQ